MVSAIFYILYAGIANDLNIYLWMAIGLIIFEGIVLLINKGYCPFTLVAKNMKKQYQVGDDIYLPKWVAKHNQFIFSIIYFIGILIVIFRLITN